MPSHVASTLPDEARLPDWDLVRHDSDEARDVLARRIDHRRRMGLPLRGLIPAHAWAFAPDETVEVLAEEGVCAAAAEQERRRLAGEWAG